MNTKRTITQRQIAVQLRTTAPRESLGRAYKPPGTLSEIRMRGKWLKAFGFEPGSKALITCHDKKLVITVLDNE